MYDFCICVWFQRLSAQFSFVFVVSQVFMTLVRIHVPRDQVTTSFLSAASLRLLPRLCCSLLFKLFLGSHSLSTCRINIRAHCAATAVTIARDKLVNQKNRDVFGFFAYHTNLLDRLHMVVRVYCTPAKNEGPNPLCISRYSVGLLTQ